MKLVLTDTLFDPLQLLRTNTGAVANNTSTQRDFIPMLILGRKVSNREGQAFKLPQVLAAIWLRDFVEPSGRKQSELIT
jgi:hypothetical protein